MLTGGRKGDASWSPPLRGSKAMGPAHGRRAGLAERRRNEWRADHRVDGGRCQERPVQWWQRNAVSCPSRAFCVRIWTVLDDVDSWGRKRAFLQETRPDIGRRTGFLGGWGSLGWIVAAGMPGVTATDSAHALPRAAHRPVLPDRQNEVLTATRIEAASRGEERT